VEQEQSREQELMMGGTGAEQELMICGAGAEQRVGAEQRAGGDNGWSRTKIESWSRGWMEQDQSMELEWQK